MGQVNLGIHRGYDGREPRPGRLLRNFARFLCLLATMAGARHAALQAAEARPLEYEVKSAFVLNFTRFVEWPGSAFADPDSPIVICVVGDDPFGRTLDQTIDGQTVNGRKLSVQRVGRDVPKACQVVFISSSEKEIPRLLTGLGPGVLTIGEADSFLREGGIISFVIDNRRVRFDINQSAAEAAKLKLSSKLLSVARSVER